MQSVGRAVQACVIAPVLVFWRPGEPPSPRFAPGLPVSHGSIKPSGSSPHACRGDGRRRPSKSAPQLRRCERLSAPITASSLAQRGPRSFDARSPRGAPSRRFRPGPCASWSDGIEQVRRPASSSQRDPSVPGAVPAPPECGVRTRPRAPCSRPGFPVRPGMRRWLFSATIRIPLAPSSRRLATTPSAEQRRRGIWS